MKKILWLASFVMLAFGASGCFVDIYDWGGSDSAAYDTTPDYYGDTTQNIVVTDGYLEGDMGNIADFRASAYEQTGEAWDGWASVQLDAGSDYWVMTRVDFEGGLDHPDLVPGAHLEYDDSSSYGAWGDNTLFVSTTGCSGPAQGDWDFDEHASHVEVDVEPGVAVNDRVIRVTSFYDGYDTAGNPTVQVVEGSFNYTVQ